MSNTETDRLETAKDRASHGRQQDDGVLVIRTVAMPADTNPAGDIFGGWIMSQMDLAAGNIAARVAQGRCVTVAVEGMQFLGPVKVGDEVTLYGTLAKVGRTSMRVHVDVWARSRYAKDGAKVTDAEFIFVSVDEEGNSRALPDS